MVSLTVPGTQPAAPRSTLGRLLAAAGAAMARGRRTGRFGWTAVRSAFLLLVRFILILSALVTAVAGVFVLAGLGWALLAAAPACLILEWIIKDAGTSGAP